MEYWSAGMEAAWESRSASALPLFQHSNIPALQHSTLPEGHANHA